MEKDYKTRASFKSSIKSYWSNTFCFNERTTIGEYWYSILFNLLIYILLFVIGISSYLMQIRTVSLIAFTLMAAFYFITIIPNISRQVRRFIDLGLAPNLSVICVIIYKISLFFVLIGFPIILTISLFQKDSFQTKTEV